MKKAREDMAAYIALVKSEMSGSNDICAVDPELGELEKERADLLAHGDRENAKLKEQEIDEAIKRKLSGLNHGESYGMAYDQLKDCSGAEKIKLYFYWKSVDGNEDLTGIEMPSWWREKYLVLPDYVSEENVSDIFYDEETRKKLYDYYYSTYFVCDCISGRGNAYDMTRMSPEEIQTKYLTNESGQLFDTWLDYVYGGRYEYVNNMDSYRSIKYAIDKNIGGNFLQTKIGIYSIYNEYQSMIFNYAVNIFTKDKYKFDIENNKADNHKREIFEELKNMSLSPKEKNEVRERIKNTHDNIMKSTYIILWSYGKADVENFEEHYRFKYSFNADKKNNEWTEEIWERFTSESAYARAAYTRRDELIYFEGICKESIIIQRLDGWKFEREEEDMPKEVENNLMDYWNEVVCNQKNVGVIDFFSHGDDGHPEMYLSHADVTSFRGDTTSSGELLNIPKWTEDMYIGSRLNFHGCHTYIPDNESSQRISNRMGVPIQANLYSSNPSLDRYNHKRITDFRPYRKEVPIYFNSYKKIDLPFINSDINTTTVYPESDN